MNFDLNGQDLNQPEPGNALQDNQLFPLTAQPLLHQFADIADNVLAINPNKTIQLGVWDIFSLLRFLPIANSKMVGFSQQMKYFEERNEMRKIQEDIDMKRIQEENDIDMREIHERTERRKTQEKNDMRKLSHEIIDREFYRALKVVLKKDLVLSVVHSLFKKPFASLAEFYCRVLSIFMLNTSLPKRLNELLKGRDQVDDLLPFLLVMCKAFFCRTLNLNEVKGVQDTPPFNFYQEVEGDEEDYFSQKKIQLKEFWIMKTEKPDFLKLLQRNVLIHYGGFYYEMMERVRVNCFSKMTQYIRTYLHIQVSEEITKDLNYSVYLRLIQEKILFVREANQVILAPGCHFIVDELFEIPVKKVSTETPQDENDNLDKKIRIIRLKMVAKSDQRIHLEEEEEEEEEDETEERVEEEQEKVSLEESEENEGAGREEEEEPRYYQPNFKFYGY
jgi:hypothetical protein